MLFTTVFACFKHEKKKFLVGINQEDKGFKLYFTHYHESQPYHKAVDTEIDKRGEVKINK